VESRGGSLPVDNADGPKVLEHQNNLGGIEAGALKIQLLFLQRGRKEAIRRPCGLPTERWLKPLSRLMLGLGAHLQYLLKELPAVTDLEAHVCIRRLLQRKKGKGGDTLTHYQHK
jgi:hypothetical protein